MQLKFRDLTVLVHWAQQSKTLELSRPASFNKEPATNTCFESSP